MRKIDDGISYGKYLEIQKGRSLKKWSKKQPEKDLFANNLKRDWERVKDVVGNPKTIGCMGIRSGAEYFVFKEVLKDSLVYGVDVAPKVTEVGENCYCYDFNNLPEDWADKFDLLYSNSIDHSFDIEQTIDEWYRVTKHGGFLMLEFGKFGDVTTSDRYDFEQNDLSKMFDDRFEILDVWENSKQTFMGLLRKK